VKSISLPDYQEKQKILYIDATPEDALIAYGDAYLAEGHIPDAAECYGRARHTPGLNKLRSLAVAMGDAMTYQQVLKALNETPPAEEWKTLGEAALATGKHAFALYAFQRSGHDDLAEKVKQVMLETSRKVGT
jgi:tetratricopeptide (TPR) repeat protein